jgi:hypothetical protein
MAGSKILKSILPKTTAQGGGFLFLLNRQLPAGGVYVFAPATAYINCNAFIFQELALT